MSQANSRLILVFCCFGHAWFHVLTGLFLTLVLFIQPIWQRPYDDLIDLWMPGALLLGLAAPLAGWMSDRWGEGRLMLFFFIGAGIATLLCGLAEGPLQLALALGLLGLFGAILHPVATAWLVRSGEKQGQRLALFGLCGSLGAAGASLLAAGLAELIDWQWAFALPGLLALSAGGGLAWAMRSGRLREVSQTAPTPADPRPGRPGRSLALLALAMTLSSLAYYAFTTMLPKWFERELTEESGGGLLVVGALVSLVYLPGAAAQFIGGYYADRGAAKTVYAASYALKVLAFALATQITGWPVVAVALALLCLFDVAAPVESYLLARFTTPRRRGLAFGLRNGIAIAAGPLGVQLVAWLYGEQFGFAAVFAALAGLSLIIVLAARLLPNADKRPRLGNPRRAVMRG